MTEGVQLDQWTCNGGTNQEWALDSGRLVRTSGDAVYQLTSLNSGQYGRGQAARPPGRRDRPVAEQRRFQPAVDADRILMRR